MSEEKDQIIKLITENKEVRQDEALAFASYIMKIKSAKKKDGTYTNNIIRGLTAKQLADKFLEWFGKGEVIDGIHITLLERFKGVVVNFDYVAYKNKMLKIYPESIVDIGLVYEGDEFGFENNSGKYTYFHKMNNVFNRTDDKCSGGFILIKNRRGEFLTTLNKSDIGQRRALSNGGGVWKEWFKEMVLKSLWRSGTKTHFDDIYQELNEEDNQQYDLNKLEENREEKQKEKITQKFKNL